MAIDRKELIELYKTTLEELRHHDTIHTQVWIGVGIIIPAFIAGIGFLFGSNSPLCSHYIGWVKWIMFVLAFFLAVFFLFTTYRINERFKACIGVLTEIENKLRLGGDLMGTSEFEELLVRSALNKIGIEKFIHKSKLRWIYIPGIIIIVLVALWLLLFKFIGG